MLANQLVTKLYPEINRGDVQLTLLSNSPDHYYKPAFMYVAFNQFFEEELKRSEKSLLRPEIDFNVEEVTRFDFNAQALHTRSGKRYGYDYLVIATGCVPAPERIEGLKEAGDHFYQYTPARLLAERLSTIKKAVFLSPYRSPRHPTCPINAGSHL